MNNFLETARILVAKLKIERPNLVVFPRFTTTFSLLWLIALVGLLYGHLVSKGEGARSLSLLLSGSSAVAALFIVLLRDPWPRLKLFLKQVMALGLLSAFLIVASLAYSLSQVIANVAPSVQFSWLFGSILVGYLSLRALFNAYLNDRALMESAYPGMRSTSLLFFLFGINWVWWYGLGLLRQL